MSDLQEPFILSVIAVCFSSEPPTCRCPHLLTAISRARSLSLRARSRRVTHPLNPVRSRSLHARSRRVTHPLNPVRSPSRHPARRSLPRTLPSSVRRRLPLTLPTRRAPLTIPWKCTRVKARALQGRGRRRRRRRCQTARCPFCQNMAAQ